MQLIPSADLFMICGVNRNIPLNAVINMIHLTG